MTPHFNIGEARLAVVETTVLIRKAGEQVELTEDELRNLCVTAGPAALEAIRALRQAKGPGPDQGAGPSPAPSNTEG